MPGVSRYFMRTIVARFPKHQQIHPQNQSVIHRYTISSTVPHVRHSYTPTVCTTLITDINPQCTIIKHTHSIPHRHLSLQGTCKLTMWKQVGALNAGICTSEESCPDLTQSTTLEQATQWAERTPVITVHTRPANAND